MEIVELIEEGGGKVTTDTKKDNLKDVYFILPNEYNEAELKEVQRLGGKKNIFTVELVMDACLHQRINWDEHRIKTWLKRGFIYQISIIPITKMFPMFC